MLTETTTCVLLDVPDRFIGTYTEFQCKSVRANTGAFSTPHCRSPMKRQLRFDRSDRAQDRQLNALSKEREKSLKRGQFPDSGLFVKIN